MTAFRTVLPLSRWYPEAAASSRVRQLHPAVTALLPGAARHRVSTGFCSQRNYYSSLNQSTPFQLCFLRHGQSTWNRDNRFIGWTDTPLTDQGVLEAKVAGQMLARSRIQFDEVHTSLLRRSIRTVNIALMELQQEYIPVYKSWRLNERNYGDLVGQNKKQVVGAWGVDQVKRWRRSYDEPPPPMREDHPNHPAKDPRYRNVSVQLFIFVGLACWRKLEQRLSHKGSTTLSILLQMLHKIPKSESLKCTLQRTSVYWDQVLAPALRAGKTVLVVGHENNLRSIIMRLEGIAPEDIIHLSLPRAVPLAYRLDENLCPVNLRPDGALDEATGFLRGEWLGGDQAVAEILERDHKQVYDMQITQNLEKGAIDQVDWNAVLPEAKAKVGTADDIMVGMSAVICSLVEPGQATLASEVVPPSQPLIMPPLPPPATSSGLPVAHSTSSSRGSLIGGAAVSLSASATVPPPSATTRRTQAAA